MRIRQILKTQRGFTLVELALTMGLMAIFLLVLTDMFASVLSVQTESEATSAVSTDGRFILQRLTYDINRATSVTTPAALGATSPSLVLVIGGVSYTYSVVGGNLQLVNDLGTSNINGFGSTVSGLTFQRLGDAGNNETVRMSFTVTSATQRNSGAEVRTFTTTVGRR